MSVCIDRVLKGASGVLFRRSYDHIQRGHHIEERGTDYRYHTLTSLSDANACRPSAIVMRLPLESYSPPAIPRLMENEPPGRGERRDSVVWCGVV